MERNFCSSQRLSEIIDRDPRILMVMSRFGISLGFGDKTVGQVCAEQDVDCPTFLAVANFIANGETKIEGLSLSALIAYLDRAHDYFLDFCLPMIRRKLIDAIGRSGSGELQLLILRFFDDYVEEVHRHMGYETREVFTYVRSLLEGNVYCAFNIDIFASRHHGIHDKLKELKDILIRYLPQKDSDLLNAVLFDIISCEDDLMSHCRVEDRLFVPAVRELEKSLCHAAAVMPETQEEAAAPKIEAVSDRERDIIECVARGMSNKEIADRLCISVNTVTTHRRNIAQKLQIHSPAGLTIYAVINGILNIEDIRDAL